MLLTSSDNSDSEDSHETERLSRERVYCTWIAEKVVIQESDKESYDSDQVPSVANESDPEVVNEYGLDDESMNHVSENITARNAELNAHSDNPN